MRKYFLQSKVNNLVLATAVFCSFMVQNLAADAQVTVTGGYTATDLANHINGTGVTIYGATLTCAANAYGEFTASGTSLGVGGGIVLTTGSAQTDTSTIGINGPASMFASTGNGTPGDADLAALGGGTTHDACALEFNFIASGSSISFDYIFGSEEYTDYTCSPFNDVFGFFISGGVYTSPTNIAKVPGTNIPVCINSINCGATGGYPTSVCSALGAGSPFCAYYVNNDSGAYITYDGMTTLLTASAAVTALDTYHLKLAVADVVDEILDSGVMIAVGSLRSMPPTQVTNHLSKEGIGIYPNPTTNSFSLTGAKGCTVRVLDLSGKVLERKNISTNNEVVDISNFPKGVYSLEIVDNITKEKVVKQVVKE